MQIFFCLTMINFTWGGKGEKRANVCFPYVLHIVIPKDRRLSSTRKQEKQLEEKNSTIKRKKKKQIANSKAESAKLRVALIERR